MSEALSTNRPGSTVIVQRVHPGREEAYREWSCEINTACSKFPGFVDLEVFEPAAGEDCFVIVVRFASEAEGNAWHTSPVCLALLEKSKSLLQQAVMRSPSRVFGGWFGGSDSSASQESPKAWKEALTVLLVLYPTVMLLSLYVTGPLLRDWSKATSMYVGNFLSVALLTWVLMPGATRALSFWLVPRQGSGTSNTLKGLALVLGSQILLVWLFHTFFH